MRVLWTHNFDPAIENAGVFMFEAAKALSRKGTSPELFYLGDLRRPSAIPKAARRLRRIAGDFDIVHSQFGSAAALATSFSGGRRLIMSIRGSDWTPAYSASLRYRAHARLATMMTQRSIPRFDVVIPVSHRIANEVQLRFPGASIEVLPDPIDTERFVPQDREVTRRRLGLDPSAALVLFTAVNQNADNKRFELAKAAVQFAQRHDPRIQLLVASGVPHSSMPDLVASADVLICTSTAEGWPNCVKEALSCNVPFVSTDVSDLRDIAGIEPSCFVVEPDARHLGEALLQSLHGQRESVLREQVACMSFERFADQLLAVYGRLK